MNGIEYLKPDKYQTKNLSLIKKAFRNGFKSGIAFMNESDSHNSDAWRLRAFKKFVEENNIKS